MWGGGDKRYIDLCHKEVAGVNLSVDIGLFYRSGGIQQIWLMD